MTKPRQTKIGKVQAMLRRPSGASLVSICKATGWQAHSARAALSGLRKAGHEITRETDKEKPGAAIYRITETPEKAE